MSEITEIHVRSKYESITGLSNEFKMLRGIKEGIQVETNVLHWRNPNLLEKGTPCGGLQTSRFKAINVRLLNKFLMMKLLKRCYALLSKRKLELLQGFFLKSPSLLHGNILSEK